MGDAQYVGMWPTQHNLHFLVAWIDSAEYLDFKFLPDTIKSGLIKFQAPQAYLYRLCTVSVRNARLWTIVWQVADPCRPGTDRARNP